ncbi:MAG: hypothetical protein IJT65_05835 [Eubacterium sp.]|nr:hypothetical protein [Eubacterium sp.]
MAKYICTGYGVNKRTGEINWYVAPILEGNKEGKPYGFIQTDQRMAVSEKMNIGQIGDFELSLKK